MTKIKTMIKKFIKVLKRWNQYWKFIEKERIKAMEYCGRGFFSLFFILTLSSCGTYELTFRETPYYYSTDYCKDLTCRYYSPHTYHPSHHTYIYLNNKHWWWTYAKPNTWNKPNKPNRPNRPNKPNNNKPKPTHRK